MSPHDEQDRGGESPTIDGQGGGGKRLDPAAKRNFLIIGGVLVGAVAIVLGLLMMTGGKKAQQATRSDVSLGTTQSSRVDGITPQMQAQLEEKQRQEAEEARRRGLSYIPPDTVGQVQPVSPAGPSSYSVATAPVAAHAAGLSADTDMRRREGLELQLRMLAGERSEGVRQRVMAENKDQQGGGRQQQAQGTAVAAAPAAAASQARRGEVIGGLTIHPAVLTSDIKLAANSQGFATARITGGPANGAFLVGQAKVVDESLEITFNQMRLGTKVYPVSARVLDETTASAAIEGNVDRKLLQRYVFPVALAVAQGFFTAKAQTGSTAVGIGSNVAGITTPAPTTDQARAAGIATGMQIASQEVQKQAQQPIVVSRERSYPVGILFNAAVTEGQQ